MMRFVVLTLFPEQILGGIGYSVVRRAMDAGIMDVVCVNIRDYAVNKRGQVDDYPYGGGAGMVMMPQPIYGAYTRGLEIANGARVVYLTPQGKPFRQSMAADYAKEDALILLCGHYEGVDERVLEEIRPEEVSVGDFVMTGGELGALMIIDAVTRLLPGALGNAVSSVDESFSSNALEYPQYTRPAEFMGRRVPDVLLSGHHGNVDKWRNEKSLERTRVRRPDLLC